MRLVIVDNFLWVLSVYAAFFGFGRALACVLGLRRDARNGWVARCRFRRWLRRPDRSAVHHGPFDSSCFCLRRRRARGGPVSEPSALLRVPSLPPDRTGRVLLAVVALLACVAIGGCVFDDVPQDGRLLGLSRVPAEDAGNRVIGLRAIQRTAVGDERWRPLFPAKCRPRAPGFSSSSSSPRPSGVFFPMAIHPWRRLRTCAPRTRDTPACVWRCRRASRCCSCFCCYCRRLNNLTANLLPIALMLCMYLLLEADTRQEQCAGRFVAMALLGSATIALKSAYLPWVGSFLAFAYGGRIIAGRFAWRTWREPAATAAIMLGDARCRGLQANLRHVGTILFPTFGRGFYASEYGMFRPPWVAPPSGGYLTALTFEARKLGPAIFAAWMIFGLMLACRRAAPRSPDGALRSSDCWLPRVLARPCGHCRRGYWFSGRGSTLRVPRRGRRLARGALSLDGRRVFDAAR